MYVDYITMELKYVAIGVAGLLGGILFRSFFDFGLSFVLLLMSLALIILANEKFWRSNLQIQTIWRLDLQGVVAVFILALAIGIYRYDAVDKSNDIVNISALENKTIQVEGIIVDEPKEKDKTTTFVASVAIEGGRAYNILVLTKPYIIYNYGDKVKIYGTLQKIRNFSRSTGGQAADFDYVAYLAKDEIYYQFLSPKIILVSRGNGSYVQDQLFKFKNSFLEKINLVISEPASSLMGGLILGAKSSLDKDLSNDFKRVGLIHIVALSGYNVTIIADSLMKVIWFLPLAVKLSVGSMAIVLFAMMTGGGSTVVRASLMVLLAMLARATGRIYLVGSALLVAAALMILYDPKIFVFDISFQLSFLATAGLIFFTPILEKYLNFITERFRLRGMLVSTLAAQLAVWPLILYKMGNFSLVSIPANLLVGPVVPYAMSLGFLTGFMGYLNYYLSLIFACISYALLFYIIKVAEIFSSIPFASINTPPFSPWAVMMIYLIYLMIVWREYTAS